jgi:hypothetical protein
MTLFLDSIFSMIKPPFQILMSGDLLIVGPGRLGLLVAGLWARQQQQAGQVYLKFRSEDPQRTRDLEQQGYVVLPPDNTVRTVIELSYIEPVLRIRNLIRSDPKLFSFSGSGKNHSRSGQPGPGMKLKRNFSEKIHNKF